MSYVFSYRVNGKMVTETAERLSEIAQKLCKLAADGNKISGVHFNTIGVKPATV